MAARSTVIGLANDTSETLSRDSFQLDWGIWSDEPPISIAPQTSVSWSSESDGVMTGTEGSVEYIIGTTNTRFMFHWNNPFFGENKYGQTVGAGYSLEQNGGSGSDAIVQLALNPTGWTLSQFSPDIHGFPFVNSWDPTPLFQVDVGFAQIPVGSADNGLCGGMVFAALDYLIAGRPIPTVQPSAGDELYEYLVERLFDSFNIPLLPLELYALQNPLYPSASIAGSPFSGHSAIMVNRAWPAIRSSIREDGLPCPLCLVKVQSFDPLELGRNHQVLVWGYELNGTALSLFLYDPNRGTDMSLTMAINISDPSQQVPVTLNPPSLGPVYCFFPTEYSPVDPP